MQYFVSDMDKFNSKVVPYIPVWCKPPNQLIRYETYDYVDPVGNEAVVTKAIFKDKNGKQQEMDAFIKWINRS